MISIRSQSHVRASPAALWALIADMERRYRDWHPEHLEWRDVRGHATEPGAVIYADERLGRFRLRGRFIIEEVVPLRRITFRLGFPYSLLHAGGWFEVEPTPDGGCELTAENHLGGRSRLGAALLDPVLRRLGRAPLAELERHMREEGERLDALAAA